MRSSGGRDRRWAGEGMGGERIETRAGKKIRGNRHPGTTYVPPGVYSGGNMKRITSLKKTSPVQLTWSHLGTLYRVTAWPEVEFQAQIEGKWVTIDPEPTSEVFSAAAVMIGRTEWKRYLDFVPAAERELLERFTWTRLSALAVITRCPELMEDLATTPALTCFISAHTLLRGSSRPSWAEISAVHGRSGLFGLLDWLGLPANRATLEALARLEDPDVPRRLLGRLREALWNPALAATFCSADSVSDVELQRFAMAAA